MNAPMNAPTKAPSALLRGTALAALLPLLLACGGCMGSISGTEADLSDPPDDMMPGEDPPTDEPPVDEPPTDEPPTDEPPVGEPPPAGTPRDRARIFFLGHSLQNWTVPSMVQSFTGASAVGMTWDASIGIGASLSWQFTMPDRSEGVNPVTTLQSTPYDVLVLTEAIPLADQVRWNDSVGYAGRFYDLAVQRNPACQTYLYETWHSRNEANWRGRLDTDLAVWESIADGVNAAHEGPDMLIIPAGQAMAALHDAIVAGRVPGITSIAQLFHDDIHLNDQGWYFVALVQYATIYRRSPVGLPAATTDRFNRVPTPPPAGAVPVMQQIAWDVVRRYERSGVAAQ